MLHRSIKHCVFRKGNTKKYLFPYEQKQISWRSKEQNYTPLNIIRILITYVCFCVCVCAGERKVLLLCSVMSAVPLTSKNCLEYQTILGTVLCCEGCVTEHKQAVPHSVCAERYLELGVQGKIFLFSTKYREWKWRNFEYVFGKFYSVRVIISAIPLL